MEIQRNTLYECIYVLNPQQSLRSLSGWMLSTSKGRIVDHRAMILAQCMSYGAMELRWTQVSANLLSSSAQAYLATYSIGGFEYSTVCFFELAQFVAFIAIGEEG